MKTISDDSGIEDNGELLGALTRAQHEVLMYVRHHIEAKGFAPSFREISAALGYTSPNSSWRLVVQLELRGMVRRSNQRTRGIDITARGMQIQQGEGVI